MTVWYADASALVRAYVQDERDHADLRQLLLEGDEPVVSSEISSLEFRSAIRAAARSGRISDAELVLAAFKLDCAGDGPTKLLAIEPEAVFGRAADLIDEHPLRTLDAIHLAVAIEESVIVAPDDDLVFVTRDDRQAEAARAEGLAVA